MLRKLYQLPIMFFCIPFVYLSLYIDVYFHSIAGFFITLFFALLIGFYFKAIDQLRLWFIGNIISTVISIFLQANHPEWSFVYQPFSPMAIVILLAGLYLIPQIIGIIWAKFLHIHLK